MSPERVVTCGGEHHTTPHHTRTGTDGGIAFTTTTRRTYIHCWPCSSCHNPWSSPALSRGRQPFSILLCHSSEIATTILLSVMAVSQLSFMNAFLCELKQNETDVRPDCYPIKNLSQYSIMTSNCECNPTSGMNIGFILQLYTTFPPRNNLQTSCIDFFVRAIINKTSNQEISESHKSMECLLTVNTRHHLGHSKISPDVIQLPSTVFQPPTSL